MVWTEDNNDSLEVLSLSAALARRRAHIENSGGMKSANSVPLATAGLSPGF